MVRSAKENEQESKSATATSRTPRSRAGEVARTRLELAVRRVGEIEGRVQVDVGVTRAAVEDVDVHGPAIERVVAGQAVQGVEAAAALDQVVGRVAGQEVGARAA